MSKKEWGNITWILFHTLACKIKDDSPVNIVNNVFSNIILICNNLPCPYCRDHASSYLKKYKDAPYRAPLIIVLVADTKEHPKVPVIEQQLSTATAGQNMLLAFHEMGFGGIWRTGKFSFNKEISMQLNLKENEIVIGYLYIGTVEGKTKKIPELNSKDFVITWE